MEKSGHDSKGELVCNVFDYDVGMMKENVDPFEVIDAVSGPISKRVLLDENVGFAKRQHKTAEPICGNFLNMIDRKKRINLQNIVPRRPHAPLLFDVFNYDLGMMKENVYKNKRVQLSKKGTNKENVHPHGEMGLPELKTPQSAKRKLKENVDPKQGMVTEMMKTPQSAKRFSQRSPLSTLSNDCHATSHTANKKQLLNYQNKIVDSTLPETPNSTLTSMFNSNVKEFGLEENGFSRNGFKRTVQTLHFGMNTERIHRTVDEIDFSRVAGFEVDEPDMFSEDEDTEDLDCWSHDNQPKTQNVPGDYASLGPPQVKCDKCEAWMWKEERTNKNVRHGTPQFALCCAKGQIQLPMEKPTPSYLWQLYNDKKKGPRFKEGIRLYNSLFAFTSTGGRVDHSINCGGAPYIYRLNGQNHHLFGSLIPDDGEDPKFCQLYIYDTENEVKNRMKWINIRDGQIVHAEIVGGLMKMLDENNELVKEFRTQRDRFEAEKVTDLEITLKVSRAENGRENHVGPSDELAGIMVGDLDDNCGFRDIVIHSYEDGLKRISDIHPKLMALQYPLLFPHGDDGFHVHLSYGSAENKSSRKRGLISQKEFYSYKLQVRLNQGMTPRLGGRLFQQYVVDAFSTIEQARLWWFRTHQTTLRNELYTQICDSLQSGNDNSSNVGKGFILPAGFIGSRRYMQQNFQDALAVCRFIGHPDIFLTMTTNPVWDEIQQMMKLLPHCLPVNSPDIIARVFKLKLDQLIGDIKKKSFFGTCLGVMYVVEFQKRGLPHVHMLIWLDSGAKNDLKKNVDKYVSAEIPHPDIDPVGYAAVKAFMIHGPCGSDNPKASCMKQFKCIRHFPKKYCPSTTFDESGFPVYKRRNNGVVVNIRKQDLDNKWVVPYNRDLLVKYQCHMNIEICCHARSIKYLFKYCLKGHDRATVEIRGKKRKQAGDNDGPVDEINEYFDGRYVCAAEAAHRIYGFNIHYRTTSVQRLSFHLPGNKTCTFRCNEPLQKVVNRERFKQSQLEAFFTLNATDSTCRQYTYDEIPQYYVWNDVDRIWNVRKRGQQIGRLFYTHHSTGELWYLRLLLTKVRGPTSYKCLRTVNGIVYSTFQEACKEYGLLDDDNEWHQVLEQCSSCGFPPQIRQLFVHIMVNCRVSDLKKLWISHWKDMSDDILMIRRKITGNQQLKVNDKQLEFYTLTEIHKLLRSIGKSLKDFSQMPQPPSNYLDCGTNNLVIEETSYNISEMEGLHKDLISNCNEEQVKVYNSIMNAVEMNEGGLFFVYGSGGCGKTYLWKTLISKLRSQSKIVLPVATSGIAATLLPGGRTAHSRFKIPIVLDDHSMCSISHQSDIAELIRRTSLIIWDEAPMQHIYAFECLDRTLRDLMRGVDSSKYHIPFGGITVVLGGDFRQILPVIPLASRSEIVSAAITRSRLWKTVKLNQLVHNMRINKGRNEVEVQRMKDFADWVLNIGDGNIERAGDGNVEDDITIPSEFCNIGNENCIDDMIDSTFPDFIQNYKNPTYLSERAILTPTNSTVTQVNCLIVERIPGQSISYFSVDTAEEFPGSRSELNNSFPTEYLNSLNVPGIPSHELKLKEGVVVMLTRNLNQTLGLCNGTRMMVTKCLPQCVQCEVISGTYVGTRHFIPRMELCPTETKLPFKLIRKQMPLQICYAMTINKSQGQSLENVGLFLPKPVFTHGQLYVAVSRVTSPEGLKIYIQSEIGTTTNITQNVVYKEVFENLQKYYVV